VDAVPNWEWINALWLDENGVFRNQRLENGLMCAITGKERLVSIED
jgi:hypothetical protein